MVHLLYQPVPPSRALNHGGFDHFGPYSEVYVFGGALYRQVVTAWTGRGLFRRAAVGYAGGRGIGDMLHELRVWMEAACPP